MNKLATLQSNTTYGGKHKPIQDLGFRTQANNLVHHERLMLAPQPQQDIQDQIERDIAALMQQKVNSNHYAHLGADNHWVAVHPIYKGNLVMYHSMSVPQEIEEEDIVLRGFLPDLWSAYFCLERTIIFWLFEPNQLQKSDLNYYFNPSDVQCFPSSVKVQKFQLDSSIVSIALSSNKEQQVGDDYLLCVASKYSIYLYRLIYRNVDIVDVIYLNYQINTNGEEIYCMSVLHDSILVGGLSGGVKRIFWEQEQSRQAGFVEVVSKKLKKLMTFSKSSIRVMAIEVDLTRQLAYALVQVSDGVNVRTQVGVYDMSGDSFDRITVLEQAEIIRRNILVVDSQAFNFAYIKALTKTEIDAHLLIVTLNGYQIMISLLEVDNRVNGSFEIRSCLQSASSFTQVPYGVMASEKRWQYRQQDTIQVEQKYIDGVYADEGILIIEKSDKLFCSYRDEGQLKFQSFLNTLLYTYKHQQLRPPHTANHAMEYSLYKNNSQQALEFMQLPLQQQQDQYDHNKQSIIASFDLSFDSSTHIHRTLPKIYATLSHKQIYFILHLRPIDLLFQYLKVTHLTCIAKNDNPTLPLEEFIQAYGMFETAALTLQLIIQQDSDFYLSVDLEKELLIRVTTSLSQHDRVTFNDQHQELTPVWVVGNVYVLKGDYILTKAKQFYYSLLQRDPLPDFFMHIQELQFPVQKPPQAQSTKVMSFVSLLRTTLSPIFQSRLFNTKAYNLEENRPLYEFTIEQLIKIDKELNEIKKLLENDQHIYVKKGNKYQDLQGNKPTQLAQRNIIKGFNHKVFNQVVVADQSYKVLRSHQQVLQDCDIEQEQVFMDKVYKFTVQVSQLLTLLIFLVRDVDIRVYLKKLTEQDRELLLNMTMSSVFQKNSSHLIMIKMLLSNIYKQYKDQARELNAKFNEFFDEYDFKINYAQNKIEQVIMQLIEDGTIIKQDESIQTKLKRLLRLNDAHHNLTYEKIIGRLQIILYYKNIPSITVDCQEISEIIYDLVRGVGHKHFIRAFKHLLVPLGMIDVYFRAQLQRALHLDAHLLKLKQPTLQLLSKTLVHHENLRLLIEQEFLDCENQIVTEFQVFCDVLLRDDTEMFKLDKKTIQVLFTDLIGVFKDFQLPTVHELVIRNLYRHKLVDHIYRMQSPFITEESFDSPLLEKFIILYNCAVQRGERVTIIEYCLKLARFSFQDQQESGFQFILQELPLTKRLEYLFEAQDQFTLLQKEAPISDNISNLVKEYKSKCRESILILKLQKIVFDCLYTSYKQNDLGVLKELELIVRYQFDFESLSDFLFTNDIFFAQLLALDYGRALQFNIQSTFASVELIYEEMVETQWNHCQELQQTWPNEEFLHQLLYLNENLINKQEYFSLECLIHFIEALNYRNAQDSWLPGFLRDSLKIVPIIILKHYIIIFMKDTLEASFPNDIEYKFCFIRTILIFLQQLLDDADNEQQFKQYQAQQIKIAQDLLNYKTTLMNFFDNQIFFNISQSRDHTDLFQLYNSVKQDYLHQLQTV